MAIKQKIIEGNKRGLFDVAVGEGNISEQFALEFQNARNSVNGEVRKRRGREYFNSTQFATSFYSEFSNSSWSSNPGGLADKSIRIKIQSSDISGSGNRIRITLEGATSGGEDLKFDACYVGIAASSGNEWDFASAPTQVLFSSSASGTVPQGSTLVSDETTFSFAKGSSLIIALDISSDTSHDVAPSASDTGNHYYHKDSADEASQTAPSGYTKVSDTLILVNDIEMRWVGPNLLTCGIFQGDYVDGYEVLSFGGRELKRYNSSSGEFDTVIKNGLSAEDTLYWAMFNGKMIFGNGVDTPFKYGYLPKPADPSTGTSTDGAKGSRTYYVRITYVSANGETVASDRVSQAVNANDVLTVTSPASTPGATGWNVYYSETSGQEKKQNASPIDIGTNHTETTGSLADISDVPSENDAWFCVNLSDNPPLFKYLVALNSRLWVSGIPNDIMRVDGCAVGDEDDWSKASDYISINVAPVISRSDEIKGLSRLTQGDKLIISMGNHILTYAVPETFDEIAIDKVIFNTGVLSHRGMGEVGVDNYIVEPDGLTSLKNEIIVQGLRTKKLSENIKDRLIPLLRSLSDGQEVNTVNYKQENEFQVNVPSESKRYIYNYELGAWAEDTGIVTYESSVTPDGYLLSAGSNGYVYREYQNSSRSDIYGDGDNDANVSFRWDTPWLWLDSVSVKKLFRYFQFKGSGSGFFTLDVFFDFESTSYKTYNLQTSASLWDESDWDAVYWDFPDINKVLIPMIGRGRAVKFSFQASNQSSLSIAFYGVAFVPAGFRGND